MSNLLRTFCLILLCSCGTKATPPSVGSNTGPTPVEPGPGTSATATGFQPGLIATPLPGDEMGVTIHRLSNGLTVYISTDRSKPSISSWIAVRAGSRHDPADSTGLAHYLEHMLFKGTSKLGSLDMQKEKPHLDRIAELYNELRLTSDEGKRAEIAAEIDKETTLSSQYSVPNEFDNLYASLGIDGVNAFTSDEQTVYISRVPSNRFDTWAEIEADRFHDPQFRLFYPELESVYEEKNRSLDSPMSRIFQAMSKALYPNHPYGTQPTIGTVDHLKTPAFADMVEYFDTWYRPNNMAIVLAGDIDAETALPVLEKHFSKLVPKELPPLPEASVEPPTERTVAKIVAPGEQAVYLSWPTVPAGHEDETALEVMDLVVDNSSTGLLNLELVLSQKLPSASSFGGFQVEAGYWILTGTAREGQSLDEVESLLLGVVAKLKSGSFREEDLQAIITNAEIQEKRGLESNDTRVQTMTDAFVEGRPWREVVQREERLRAVKVADVVRVANKYLTDAPVVVQRVRGEFSAPKVEKPSITAIKIDSSKKSPYATEIVGRKVKALEPEFLQEGKHFSRMEGSAGPALLVKNNRNDLFSVNFRFDFGSRQEPLVCLALELLQRSGAGDKDAIALQRELYAMGTTIDFYCSAQRINITVSGLDRHMDASLAVLANWLTNPKIPEGAQEKLVANTISQRKDATNEPSMIFSALNEYAQVGRESRFLAVASNKSLKKASEKSLLALLDRLQSTTRKLSYYGPRELDEAAIAKMNFGAKHKSGKRLVPRSYQKQTRPTIYYVNQKVAQAQVGILWPQSPSAKAPENERTLARLFDQYVGGGMGGLVFQEIREARGLAYSASAYFADPSRKADHRAIVGRLGTQADKTVEALSTLVGILAPLKVEAGRFATAKRSVLEDIRKQRIDARNRASYVYWWEDVGADKDPREAIFREIPAVTEAQLSDFAGEYTKRPAAIAITGDEERIDKQKVKAVLPKSNIREMPSSKLFGY